MKFNENYLHKARDFVHENKKNILAAIIALLVILLIIAGFSVGSKNPIKTPEEPEKTGGVLETSFDRWYRGENNELLASFFLQNHSKDNVEKIEITCVAFSSDNKELNRFNKTIELQLLPNEERVLSKTYIGKLDLLTQKVICQISNWE